MVQMKNVEVRDLDGKALDWAVAKAAYGCEPNQIDWELLGTWYAGESTGGYNDWEPRVNWVQGGALIEKFRIGFLCSEEMIFASVLGNAWDYSGFSEGEMPGNTHLIAACRAIVAHRYGMNVEVPISLVT
ncbi:DUF2591 domain-containing protein [Aeromonas jandaei]|nr:DUF2591 domain-containing protein [Aeromonas jandaei]